MQDTLKFSLQPTKPALVMGFRVIFTVVFCTLCALLFGFFLGVGAYPLVILIVLSLTGLLILARPDLALWGGLAFSLCLTGLIELYIPSVSLLKWSVPVLSLLLGLMALIVQLVAFSKPRTIPISAQYLWLAFGFFLLSALLSEMINWDGFKAFIVGFKGYFQAWGFLLAIYVFIKTPLQARRLIQCLYWLALIQLPFVFHEYWFLVPQRTNAIAAAHGVVAVDIVAGTFGGSMYGGGRSALLAALIVIAVALLLAKWQRQLISTASACALAFIVFIPMLLNEAKIILVLLPLAILFLFKNEIVSRPLRFLLIVAALIFSLMLAFYSYAILPNATQKSQNLQHLLSETIAYNFGDKGYGNDKLNRTSVYSFWLSQQKYASPIQTLFGQGLGQTNAGSLVNTQTLATHKYASYGIGLTAISSLLWETGVVGLFVILAMFLIGMLRATLLKHDWKNTTEWPYIVCAQVGLMVLFVELWHNNFFVFDLIFQTIFVILFGYLLVMSKFAKPAE